MESPYPFDPHDWTTIALLFSALVEEPVPSGGLPGWLARWNELDIAVHDAWTTLKRHAYADTTNSDAERAYRVFTKEMFSTHLGLTNVLAARALALAPEPLSPSHRELWRRWRNQTALFKPESLPIQARISELEGGYRELTRRIERQPGDPRANWLEHREALNALMLELLSLRRALARTGGESTFLAYRWRELGRLDWSVEACQALHRAVERVVVPAAARLRTGEGGAASVPVPALGDPADLADVVERMLTGADEAFGAVFRAMRAGHLDLGARHAKAETSEQWFFPRAGLPYIHDTSSYLPTLLHESGHAVHAHLSFRAQRSMWNFYAHEEFQEFAATGMELLCWPFYDQARGGPFTSAESAAMLEKDLRFYLEGMVGSAMEDAFEHWLYGEAPQGVTPAEIDTKWLELKRRFMPWQELDPDDPMARTGWQRGNWSLFRIPLYHAAYVVAIVGTCLLGGRVRTDRAGAIEDYKAALSLGSTAPLPQLFRVAGLTLPFAEPAVEEAVRFVLDERGRVAAGPGSDVG